MKLRFFQLLACGATLSIAPSGEAADAACSASGDVIYRVNSSDSGQVVQKIVPASGELTPVELPKTIVAEDICGLSVSNAGHLLIAVPNAVWALDVEKNKAVRVCAAPEGVDITGIGYDSNTSAVCILAWADGELASDLWILPKGAKSLLPVVNRRAGGITGLTFLKDSRIVFASRGDLWIGTLYNDEEEKTIWSLEALRFAPVGEWETANATSNSYGAREVIPFGDGVLAQVGRFGGSGSGKLIKVAVPPADTADATYKLMAGTLAGVEELGQTGMRPWICGSSTGEIAFYFLDTGRLIRARVGKEPEEVGTFGDE